MAIIKAFGGSEDGDELPPSSSRVNELAIIQETMDVAFHPAIAAVRAERPEFRTWLSEEGLSNWRSSKAVRAMCLIREHLTGIDDNPPTSPDD